MYLAEQQIGAYRIYGGALEVPDAPGFLAAVSVVSTRGPCNRQIVFQDERLAGGHRFTTGEAALRFAMKQGRRAVARTS
jgi:hypothetical protein